MKKKTVKSPRAKNKITIVLQRASGHTSRIMNPDATDEDVQAVNDLINLLTYGKRK